MRASLRTVRRFGPAPPVNRVVEGQARVLRAVGRDYEVQGNVGRRVGIGDDQLRAWHCDPAGLCGVDLQIQPHHAAGQAPLLVCEVANQEKINVLRRRVALCALLVASSREHHALRGAAVLDRGGENVDPLSGDGLLPALALDHGRVSVTFDVVGETHVDLALGTRFAGDRDVVLDAELLVLSVDIVDEQLEVFPVDESVKERVAHIGSSVGAASTGTSEGLSAARVPADGNLRHARRVRCGMRRWHAQNYDGRQQRGVRFAARRRRPPHGSIPIGLFARSRGRRQGAWNLDWACVGWRRPRECSVSLSL